MLPGLDTLAPFYSEGEFADISCCRHINFSNATSDQLEQLARACQPASSSFGDYVSDGTYCKAGTMETESFCPVLDPFYTDMIKIIRGCLLEGTHSTKNIKIEPYKLSVNGTHFYFIYSQSS